MQHIIIVLTINNITTVNDFLQIKNNNETYQLQNDIDFQFITNYIPLNFTGILIGNNFTVKNLIIQTILTDKNPAILAIYSGIFGYGSVQLKDLKLNNITISLLRYGLTFQNHIMVGTILGSGQLSSQNVQIENSKIEVFGNPNKRYIGGLVGNGSVVIVKDTNINIIIINLHGGNGQTSGFCVGGLIGYSQSINVEFSNINVSISSNALMMKQYTGGIVGYALNSTTTLAISVNLTLDISNQFNQIVGGICGFCYVHSTNSVIAMRGLTNTQKIGAIIGGNFDSVSMFVIQLYVKWELDTFQCNIDSTQVPFNNKYVYFATTSDPQSGIKLTLQDPIPNYVLSAQLQQSIITYDKTTPTIEACFNEMQRCNTDAVCKKVTLGIFNVYTCECNQNYFYYNECVKGCDFNDTHFCQGYGLSICKDLVCDYSSVILPIVMGIVIGGIAGLVLFGFGIYYIIKWFKKHLYNNFVEKMQTKERNRLQQEIYLEEQMRRQREAFKPKKAKVDKRVKMCKSQLKPINYAVENVKKKFELEQSGEKIMVMTEEAKQYLEQKLKNHQNRTNVIVLPTTAAKNKRKTYIDEKINLNGSTITYTEPSIDFEKKLIPAPEKKKTQQSIRKPIEETQQVELKQEIISIDSPKQQQQTTLINAEINEQNNQKENKTKDKLNEPFTKQNYQTVESISIENMQPIIPVLSTLVIEGSTTDNKQLKSVKSQNLFPIMNPQEIPIQTNVAIPEADKSILTVEQKIQVPVQKIDIDFNKLSQSIPSLHSSQQSTKYKIIKENGKNRDYKMM